MYFTVCLACGRAGCSCGGGPRNKAWRAPVATMKDAMKATVPTNSAMVYGVGPDEDFDTIWGGDPDWNLSLETF